MKIKSLYRTGHILLICFMAVAAFTALTGCNEDDIPFITLSEDSIELGQSAHQQTIEVKSHSVWNATSDAGWCRILNGDGSRKGSFRIVVDENDTVAERIAAVTVTGNGVSSVLMVKQSATDAALVLSTEAITFYRNADSYNVTVTSNHDWRISSSSGWCKLSITRGSMNNSFEVSVDENTTNQERTAQISIVSENSAPPISKTINVRQSASSAAITVMPKETTMSSLSEQFNVLVLTSVSWKASASVDWLSIDKDSGTGDGTIRVTTDDNTSGKERIGIITVYTTENGGDREIHTITVTQTNDEYYLEVPVTEYILDKNAAELDVKYILAGINCRAEADANASWVNVVSAENGIVKLSVDANTTAERRNCTVTINSAGQAGEPIVRTVAIWQSATENILDIFFSDITTNPLGETLRIPIVTNTAVDVRCSSTWCTVSVDGSDIVIVSKLNNSGFDREAIITAEVTNTEGNKVAKAFKVIQPFTELKFEFPKLEYTLDCNGESLILPLSAIGDWILSNAGELPSWISISPTEGSGNTNINFTATKNSSVSNRTVNLIFKNTLTGMTLMLPISQPKHPDILISDYKYLGKGYDAGGEYAVDSYVKAAVLDHTKLEAADYIADILVPNSTVESSVYGKTLQEYQKAMTVKADASATFRGFTTSVTSSFSQQSYGAAENEFANFKHVTSKHTVKLMEHVTAEMLRGSLTSDADTDINGTMAAADVIKKYGTHVIAGFVLGGCLDYYMSYDRTASSNSTEWSAAVKGGYKKLATSITSGAEYTSYQSLFNSSVNFEERLIARGGDSQYASGRGDQNTYNAWLTSLSTASKWVMVDYAGSKLIPIWEFANDASRRTSLEAAAKAHIESNPISQSTSYKTLQIQATTVTYVADDTGDKAEIYFKIFITPPGGDETIFKNQYTKMEIQKRGGEEKEITSATTLPYKLNAYKSHTVRLRIDGYETDQGTNDDPFKRTVDLTYSDGKWTYTAETYNSNTELMESPSLKVISHGGEFVIGCTNKGGPTDHAEALFKFKLSWQ